MDSTISRQTTWLMDKPTMAKAGVSLGASIPEGAESLLIQRIPPTDANSKPGMLFVFSERPRSLSDREQAWVGAIAQKIGSFV